MEQTELKPSLHSASGEAQAHDRQCESRAARLRLPLRGHRAPTGQLRPVAPLLPSPSANLCPRPLSSRPRYPPSEVSMQIPSAAEGASWCQRCTENLGSETELSVSPHGSASPKDLTPSFQGGPLYLDSSIPGAVGTGKPEGERSQNGEPEGLPAVIKGLTSPAAAGWNKPSTRPKNSVRGTELQGRPTAQPCKPTPREGPQRAKTRG
ncbi:Hypothetical predicted protein [Marmota monax]|uniref:Uncharacterized protein n=1 Tax=Marmota monax TaxID=9995 RepID=A0A5E4CZZ5_MARMO|nr:Hypothetical predicted protein [Marmota monax]